MNKVLVLGGLLLVLLVPSAFAGSQSPQATALCVELQGNAETRYDVKARTSGKCARGERKVALPRGVRGTRGARGRQAHRALPARRGRRASRARRTRWSRRAARVRQGRRVRRVLPRS